MVQTKGGIACLVQCTVGENCASVHQEPLLNRFCFSLFSEDLRGAILANQSVALLFAFLSRPKGRIHTLIHYSVEMK